MVGSGGGGGKCSCGFEMPSFIVEFVMFVFDFTGLKSVLVVFAVRDGGSLTSGTLLAVDGGRSAFSRACRFLSLLHIS